MVRNTGEDSSDITEMDKIGIDYLMHVQNRVDLRFDSQNDKISYILTIDGVIFGIIAVMIDKIANGILPGIILMLIGSISLFVSIICGIFSYQLVNYDMGLSKDIKNIIFNSDKLSVENQIINFKKELEHCASTNLDSVKWKTLWGKRALDCQYFGICFLFIGYCIIAFLH